MQEVRDVHDTPFSAPPVAPGGIATASSEPVDPSRRSASSFSAPELAAKLPTAMQWLADVHDTPFRATFVAPAGVAILRLAQCDPFQRSAWRPPPNRPTAVHDVPDAHDTPLGPALLSPPLL